MQIPVIQNAPAMINEVAAKGSDWYRLSWAAASQNQVAAYANPTKSALQLDAVWINKAKNQSRRPSGLPPSTPAYRC